MDRIKSPTPPDFGDGERPIQDVLREIANEISSEYCTITAERLRGLAVRLDEQEENEDDECEYDSRRAKFSIRVWNGHDGREENVKVCLRCYVRAKHSGLLRDDYGPLGQMFAMVNSQGTACAETALCADHYTKANRAEAATEADKDVRLDSWTDCSGNVMLECRLCCKGA